jgi:hypothetical protein
MVRSLEESRFGIPMSGSVDGWDDVWAEYDRRAGEPPRAAGGAAPAPLKPATGPARAVNIRASNAEAGNTGTSNTGTSNTGTSNTGTSNTGTSNTGTSNTETGNTETGNTEASNAEAGNTETSNKGRARRLVTAGAGCLLLGGWLFLAVDGALGVRSAVADGLASRDVVAAVVRQDLVGRQLQALFLQGAAVRVPDGDEGPRGASRYLAAMAGDLAQSWNAPDALLEVIAARMSGPGVGTPQGSLRGPTRFDLEFGEGHRAMTVQVELTEFLPPRWQVTGVGFAAIRDARGGL